MGQKVKYCVVNSEKFVEFKGNKSGVVHKLPVHNRLYDYRAFDLTPELLEEFNKNPEFENGYQVLFKKDNITVYRGGNFMVGAFEGDPRESLDVYLEQSEEQSKVKFNAHPLRDAELSFHDFMMGLSYLRQNVTASDIQQACKDAGLSDYSETMIRCHNGYGTEDKFPEVVNA